MDDSPQNRRRFWKRFARETQAGPIVEFAIIVPVLLLLLLGIIDFAFAFFRQNMLVGAVREGGRYAAVQENLCLTATQDAIKARVRGYFNPTIKKASDTLTNSMIAIDSLPTCPGSPLNVTKVRVVVANYTYTPINPAFRLARSTGILNLSAQSIFRWERSP